MNTFTGAAPLMTTEGMSEDRVESLRRLAIECLNNYRDGLAGLEQLDRDLKSIIRTLNDIAETAWTKSLLRQWGHLEIIYSLALADGRVQLSEDEEADVRVIVSGLYAEFRGEKPPSGIERGDGPHL